MSIQEKKKGSKVKLIIIVLLVLLLGAAGYFAYDKFMAGGDGLLVQVYESEADPMVLDGAFQMAIVWSFEQTGSVFLPSYARSYRQYRPAFPESGATAVMTVTRHTHRKMVADFTFLDADDQVVATIKGYEATVDQTLMQAFRNNGQPPVIQANP